MICPICGVKVTSPDVRRQRFAHIDLPVSITLSLKDNAEALSVMPVLSAVFIESNGGEALSLIYENLPRASVSNSREGIQSGWESLVELLLPVLLLAHAWNLTEAGTIARGLALELRTGGGDGRCERCGYPFAGLNNTICPGCGSSRSLGESNLQ